MLLRPFCYKLSSPHPSACWSFGIRSGHVCRCDATAGRRNISALCELCQGCGPGRYGLDAISSSALRVPAAAAESRETSAVAQVAHSTAAGLLALGCTSTYPMVTCVRLPITRVRVRVRVIIYMRDHTAHLMLDRAMIQGLFQFMYHLQRLVLRVTDAPGLKSELVGSKAGKC